MIERFCEVYLKKLRAIREDFVKPCIDNSLKSMEDYRFINGKIQGLERAESLIKEIYSELYEVLVRENERHETEVFD